MLIVIATKYFHESGFAESWQLHAKSRGAFARFVVDHSLTIVLVATGRLAICEPLRIRAMSPVLLER